MPTKICLINVYTETLCYQWQQQVYGFVKKRPAFGFSLLFLPCKEPREKAYYELALNINLNWKEYW